MTRYEDAEQFYLRAIDHDPHRVACYNRLARLRRVNLRQIEAANTVIRDMVAKNPDHGRAYIYHWLFIDEFARPAFDSDIAQALKLAPDDSEVLLTAAVASEHKGDTVAARGYWERAFQVDPKNRTVAIGLARLEAREGHLERAEDVLRKAYESRPSPGVAYELADVLIRQGKIDGKDEARQLHLGPTKRRAGRHSGPIPRGEDSGPARRVGESHSSTRASSAGFGIDCAN